MISAVQSARQGVAATPKPTEAHIGCAENCARHSRSAM
jgi:hypothetical protein